MSDAEIEETMASISKKCILPALTHAFAKQASVIVKAEVVPTADVGNIDLVATITFRSTKFQGVIGLCFPSPTFLGIVNQMLGESWREINDENADAAGEFLNIIYASARVMMNQIGHDFAPAIPTVLRGNSLQIMHGHAQTRNKILCMTEGGLFHLDASLRAL